MHVRKDITKHASLTAFDLASPCFPGAAFLEKARSLERNPI